MRRGAVRRCPACLHGSGRNADGSGEALTHNRATSGTGVTRTLYDTADIDYSVSRRRVTATTLSPGDTSVTGRRAQLMAAPRQYCPAPRLAAPRQYCPAPRLLSAETILPGT